MALELNANRRIGLALLWLALLAVAGLWLSETLKVTGDLRKFMPALRKNNASLQPDAARGRRAFGRCSRTRTPWRLN
ncbi:hypothetical protein XcfCFBP6990P_20290 [Xanthomonas citri pv. phaseoli var. fuscans]|uniref:Uncharacterized protein n=1 Tax=Xanthomonas citri pv. phaseoli var. fuscans TaxID=473423 RepID=A0AB33F978_XANCI|nr:hypothetical protein [Xanthomonas citri]ATS36830.1 hypothetical protein XcfCFBP6988P_00625 [Xanthomonas citri pv. phaseoli var. fuscans]ATS44361.1 hypothetical protein XcfCFBP6989P_19840 [Xanthomonas citri pv. phaseoli var. fuscans]ATS48725.1 hypothetical protein XcfCFBP6990P_20290 [Xanthomonas citri pv. phaseoli var. fuscans]ATS84897.1 hypothetical protein XcfCFBP6991P_13945 [Xanthomonas citri pv. phaseoli var. fuscans]QWN22335.1 hypothetical protein DGM98_21380 [Xanthomonas citri]